MAYRRPLEAAVAADGCELVREAIQPRLRHACRLRLLPWIVSLQRVPFRRDAHRIGVNPCALLLVAAALCARARQPDPLRSAFMLRVGRPNPKKWHGALDSSAQCTPR